MSGRIWPGALCYITHPSDQWFGRTVEALFVITREDQGLEGKLLASEAMGCWMCRAQGFKFPDRVVGPVDHVPIEARWLRPILPPPGSESTEDRAPCELQPGEIVGV